MKLAATACLAMSLLASGTAKEKHAAVKQAAASTGPAILWSDPGAIGSRDLYYGPGGKEHMPAAPFTFLKEDLNGTNPKFDVKDADGVKWKVKLGIEARPETVATRIVWAVGYFANEDYFLPELKVSGMPARLKRGWKLVGPDGTMHNVRLKRQPKDEKKIGNWRWRSDAFNGTREWNGLRALMAVLNNWDLKDINNTVYQVDGRRIYMVSDLGASFGWSGRTWPPIKSKGNLESYSRSRFIRDVTPSSVDFETPARPRWVLAVNPKEFFSRVHLQWIGRNVPRQDAKWMGELLARITPQQLHDAFRAAGYTPQEADGFIAVLTRRIAVLTDL